MKLLGKALQNEGTASARVLRRKPPCYVQGTSRGQDALSGINSAVADRAGGQRGNRGPNRIGL